MIQNYWSRIFSSKFFLVTLIIMIALIGYSIFKARKDQQTISENIKSLEEEIAGLENKSLDLAEMIKYLRSDDYIDKEAREKLVMKKQGEKVVIVPEEKEKGAIMGTEELIKANWRLWVDYFFSTEKHRNKR